MSGYRIGDQTVMIKGVETRLRLTVSGLAELAAGLGAGSPKALADRLRCASVSDWNIVLNALANPRPTGALSKPELMALMPKISTVFADGLTP